MGKMFHAEEVSGGILKIILDLPDSPVNAFNQDTLNEFEQLIGEMEKDRTIRGLYVVSGKPGHFHTGVDLHETRALTSLDEAYVKARHAQKLMERWQRLPFPTFAVIEGVCQAEAAEWALYFSFRLVSDDSAVAIRMPQSLWGYMPSWGGTVFLSRVIGVQLALEMLLEGKTLSAQEAYRTGFADELAPSINIDQIALNLLKKLAEETDKGRDFTLQGKLKLKTRAGRNRILRRFSRAIRQSERRFYPADQIILNCVQFALENDVPDALEYEARQYTKVVMNEKAKNILSLEFIRRSLITTTGSPSGDSGAFPGRIGIIGAGESGIALTRLAIMHGHPVRLRDVSESALSRALRSTHEFLSRNDTKARDLELKMDLLSPTTTLSGFSGADLVFVAVPDDEAICKEVVNQVSRRTSPKAIIAVHTATVSISAISQACRNPSRLIGIQLFSSSNSRNMVEIIPGETTSPETISLTKKVFQQWNIIPMAVADCPGFLVNRLTGLYFSQALKLLLSGVAIDRIDSVMKEFGMDRGPFEWLDHFGLEKARKLLHRIAGQSPAVEVLAQISESFSKDHSTDSQGMGFYLYNSNDPAPRKVNRGIYRILNLKPRRKMSSEEITERLLFWVINEASYCLSEKVVTGPEYIDAASVWAMGFPAFHGGLLTYADGVGAQKIAGKLAYVSENGVSSTPIAPLLQSLADERKGFMEGTGKSYKV